MFQELAASPGCTNALTTNSHSNWLARLSPCAGEPTAYDNLLSIHAGGQGVRRSRPHERHSHDPGYRDDPRRPHEHGPAVRAINAALVLLIDHDLAVSTFAARVAASA
ncbi:hypothetical protein IFR11_15630, partial [Microbacterium sp. CFBP 8801]|nr:hypothetical protein [Microbacterium sp. CFBP 8801]